MNNNRDMNPELDYFELRRRHEEFKSRQRMAEAADAEPSASPAPQAVNSRNAAPAENIPEDVEFDQQEAFDAADDYADEGDYGDEYYDEEYDEAYDEPEQDVNPFKTLFNLAKGAKNKLSGKRGKQADFEDEAYEDEAYDDEAYEEGEFDGEDYPEEEAQPVKKRSLFGRRQSEPAFDEAEYDDLGDDAADIEDVAADMPAAQPVDGEDYQDEDYADEDYADEDYADEDYADEDYDGDAPQESGLKRFLNMFVVRVDDASRDDADAYYDDEYEDEDYSDDEAYADDLYEDQPYEDEVIVEEAPRPLRAGGRHALSKTEGGLDMDEMNRSVPETANSMANALESSGMSRRERRELAMRKAAEEAARQAEIEAAQRAEAERIAAEQAAAMIEEPVIEEAPAAQEIIAVPEEKPVDMAAFKDVDDESIVVTAEDVDAEEISEEIADFAVEEPTREFKPVNLRAMQEAADAEDEDDLFGIDEEDEDEDEDDEEEEVKKPRFSLFGKKRARKEEIDEDEDDYDDLDDEDDEDDYDDEEDEDEDEDDRPAKRRGLFGRRKKVADDDEDDDEDVEDDDYIDDEDEDDADEYDEEDDDDSYDEYEDDEDDYDEDEYDEDYDDEDEDEFDDEDDDHRSFGHHLIGAIKAILGVVLALLTAVIVLNVLYMAGHGAFVERLNDRFGDSSAFKFLFFSYGMRTEEVADPETPALVDALEIAPVIEEPVQEEIELIIPDLDANFEDDSDIDFGMDTSEGADADFIG